MKKLNLFFVFFISFIYMELVYKIFIYHSIFRLSIINMILFLIPFSLLLSVLCNAFKNEKVNKIIYIVLFSLIAIWFSAQYVVKSYFDFYIKDYILCAMYGIFCNNLQYF